MRVAVVLTAVAAGLAILMAGTVHAQTVTLYCPPQDLNKADPFVITLDYSRTSVTYVDRGRKGDGPAIVSRPNITETNISWEQKETWGNVSYNLSRLSGEINYTYFVGSEPRSGRRNCVKAEPRF